MTFYRRLNRAARIMGLGVPAGLPVWGPWGWPAGPTCTAWCGPRPSSNANLNTCRSP